MKFLLTSAGIKNESIFKALEELLGKSAEESSVLFVITAANTEIYDKGWLVEDLNAFREKKFKSIDVFDIAQKTEEMWRPHFENVDLVCFGGGNEQYLAKMIKESGLAEALPEFLKTKVYMGISAGSMVVSQFLSHDLMKVVYPEETYDEMETPLSFVDCLFLPHLNSPWFPHVKKETLESLKDSFTHSLYACDDNSALKVIDGKIEVVSESDVVVYNK